eukprot:331481-Pyramimonas_sp.AAC.1
MAQVQFKRMFGEVRLKRGSSDNQGKSGTHLLVRVYFQRSSSVLQARTKCNARAAQAQLKRSASGCT